MLIKRSSGIIEDLKMLFKSPTVLIALWKIPIQIPTHLIKGQKLLYQNKLPFNAVVSG
jgi:hypothetical protein